MATNGAALMVGVSGLRGVLGQSLTPEVAARFSGAFGSWIVDQASGGSVRVVLGRDGRRGSEWVHSAALAGLVSAGVDVVDLGIAMTPTVGLMTDRHEAHGGMVVTASHNPQTWCGLKCLLPMEGPWPTWGASAPPPDLAQAIIERFESGEVGGAAWNRVGRIERDETGSAVHVEAVLSEMGADPLNFAPPAPGRGPKVVLDSVNASGSVGGRRLLEEMGCEVVHINAERSGVFGRGPEPIAENLQQLCDEVRQQGAQLGFAQDPDGDRLAIVDETGRFIGEEYTFALASMALLSGENEMGDELRIATNLSTSRMIDDIAELTEGVDIEVVRGAVGEANVATLLRETPEERHALVGGEGNGGVVWPRVTMVRDSLSAMALVLVLLERSGRALSELVSDVPRYTIVKRKQDLSKKEDAGPLVERIALKYADMDGVSVDTRDGVRVDWHGQRGWVHVRASNTEPILRMIAEAPTPKEADEILDGVSALA